jgi:hypothetical protein
MFLLRRQGSESEAILDNFVKILAESVLGLQIQDEMISKTSGSLRTKTRTERRSGEAP